VVPADALAEVRDNVLRAGEEIAAASAAETAPSAMVEGFTERATELMAARGFLPNRDAHPDPAARRSVEQHNSLLDEVSAELGLTEPYGPGVPTARTNAGLNDVVYYPAIAEYLADPRVVGVARALLDPHVRIAQLEINKTIHGQSSSSGQGHSGPTPAADRRSSGPWFDAGPQDRRHWHSGKCSGSLSVFLLKKSQRSRCPDWPHDIGHVAGGHIAQPFPDCEPPRPSALRACALPHSMLCGQVVWRCPPCGTSPTWARSTDRRGWSRVPTATCATPAAPTTTSTSTRPSPARSRSRQPPAPCSCRTAACAQPPTLSLASSCS